MLEHKKILLIGDLAIDRYHWGRCRDFNPEAPVPILDLDHSDEMPGMAGNVEANLRAFGCEVDTLYGNRTSIKNRYMDQKTKRCLLRVDSDRRSDPVKAPNDLSMYDAIVISDYNKGSVTVDLVEDIVDHAQCRIFMDTKMRDLAALEGVTLKINRKEWEARTSMHSDTVVTLGEDGVMYGDLRFNAKAVDVHDVCGAGDTFLAAMTAGWLIYGYMERALELGLAASAIAVRHPGTYTLSRADVEAACASL